MSKKFIPKHVLVVDWETTGAEFGMPVEQIAKKYQGISIGVVVADFDTLEEVDSLYATIKYDPAYVWTQEAENIHGLTRDDLEETGLTREEVVIEVMSIIAKYWTKSSPIIFCGHNAAFDKAFFDAQILKPFNLELNFHHVVLDSAVIGMVLLGTGKSNDVFDCLAMGEERGLHNSLEDARLCLASLRNAKLIFNGELE